MKLLSDPLMTTAVLAATEKPQQLIWLAAHQDYSSDPVYNKLHNQTEVWYGERAIDMLLKGDKGHFGCTEHPQITFNCCYYPHSVMVQARTHRVGVSFDVQSFRYTSQSILSIKSDEALEKTFYFRPTGDYTDRQGHKYTYTEDDRNNDKYNTLATVLKYKENVSKGFSEEHARECLTTNYRQHFVVSFNLRSLFHFLDLRGKADAQIEIQHLATALFNHSLIWAPELTQWYEQKRWKKARLAP